MSGTTRLPFSGQANPRLVTRFALLVSTRCSRPACREFSHRPRRRAPGERARSWATRARENGAKHVAGLRPAFAGARPPKTSFLRRARAATRHRCGAGGATGPVRVKATIKP
eukprot:10485437-Lingulodinium_polyedra.AAC.1